MEVAGEYDFQSYDQYPEGKLKQTVLDELAPQYHDQPLASYWLSALGNLLEAETDRWKWLAAHLLDRLNTRDAQLLPLLHSLAQSGPTLVRGPALAALVRSAQSDRGKQQLDEETQALLSAALTSDDRTMVQYGLRAVVYDHGANGNMSVARLLFQPELIPLLFHPTESIRRQSRLAMRRISKADATKVFGALMEVLNDSSRQADHRPAIRALSALGSHAQPAVPHLEEIMKTSGDLPLRVAAAVAIDRIEEGSRGGNYLLTITNNSSDEKLQNLMNRLANEERRIQGQ